MPPKPAPSPSAYTGPDIPIRTSYGAGGAWNNPIGPDASGQASLALGWNRTNNTNQQAAAVPRARGGEWVSELFYKATIFKGMNLTQDVQVFWNPALAPRSELEAVFTLRTSVSSEGGPPSEPDQAVQPASRRAPLSLSGYIVIGEVNERGFRIDWNEIDEMRGGAITGSQRIWC